VWVVLYFADGYAVFTSAIYIYIYIYRQMSACQLFDEIQKLTIGDISVSPLVQCELEQRRTLATILSINPCFRLGQSHASP
jgi:hypothetical protein